MQIEYPRCESRFEIFLNPCKQTNREALAICQQCQDIKTCARLALGNGSSCDGKSTLPANGVIMAGVVCEWSCKKEAESVIAALEAVAGVRGTFQYSSQRPKHEGVCKGCGVQIVTRLRAPGGRKALPLSEYPDGVRPHAARGLCHICYKQFQKEHGQLERDQFRKARRLIRRAVRDGGLVDEGCCHV